MLKHLKDAAFIADKAGDAAKVARMEEAMRNVGKRGIFAAGKDVLEELGLPTAIKFSIPLSGRIGRGIFERPLKNIPGVGQRFGSWATRRRVGQLKPINTEVPSLVDPRTLLPLKALDDVAIQTRVLKAAERLAAAKRAGTTGKVKAQIIKDAPKTGAQVIAAVGKAQRMPIEFGFSIPIGFAAMAVIAGVPGRAMG